ncbi:MAG: SoxR reducing system RseC family protein [Bacteroidales bacterium]|nr:SoxR reducing system RseC family protein [Bacteroidales bacterium]MDY0348296.1 SoxR reducing system RseC family protein [Tenuifilaceae bacterium]
MAQKIKTVDHHGSVQEVTTNNITVKIISQSACAACHAKGACGLSDTTEKIVVVHKPNHGYTVGQDVKVILRQSLGFKALTLGYLFPFLLMVLVLIMLTVLGVGELKAGLLSLATLVPYYIVLHLFNSKISRLLTFDIESI